MLTYTMSFFMTLGLSIYKMIKDADCGRKELSFYNRRFN